MAQQTKYNLLVPCYQAQNLNSKIVKCRLNFEVTAESFCFSIYDFSTNVQTSISSSTWKSARIFDWYVMFLDERNIIQNIFFFFNDENSFKRFLFSLIEAGILIANEISTTDFRFLAEHSFIPETDFSAAQKAITSQMRAIMQFQLSLITQNKVEPFNQNYVVLCLPYLLYFTNLRIKSWVSNRQSHLTPLDQISRYKTEQILDTFEKHIKIDDDDFDQRIEALKDPKLVQLLRPIVEHSEYQNQIRKATLKIARVCGLVLQMHCAKTKKFSKQHFVIVHKICSLMLKQGQIKDDDPVTLPAFMNNLLLDDTKDDISQDEKPFIKYLLAFFEYFITPFEEKYVASDAEMASSLSKSAINILKTVLPHVASYLVMCDIKNFTQFKNAFPPLLASLLTDNYVWPFWIWLMKIQNRIKGLECAAAAIIFIWIPEMLKNNVQKEVELPKTLPKLDENFQSFIETTFYFYAMYKSEK